MFVLIAGGGRTGSTLAGHLTSQNHRVRLIEHRGEVLQHLHRELPTEVVFEGIASHPEVLEEAGVKEAQVLAACMPEDADNLALCYVARTLYGVPRTIACINNPRSAWLFDSKFHVDVALNQADILAHLIEEEMSLGDMMTLLKLRRGRFSLVEEKIPAGAPAVGRAIKDLHFPANAVIAAIIRRGEIVIPHGGVAFEAGDEVLAVVDGTAAEVLARMFTDNPGGP